jgi:hypothetical protein
MGWAGPGRSGGGGRRAGAGGGTPTGGDRKAATPARWGIRPPPLLVQCFTRPAAAARLPRDPERPQPHPAPLQTLNEYIEDTEDLVNLKLDQHRNQVGGGCFRACAWPQARCMPLQQCEAKPWSPKSLGAMPPQAGQPPAACALGKGAWRVLALSRLDMSGPRRPPLSLRSPPPPARS